MQLYKMSYGNLPIENSSVYNLERETKCYIFLHNDIHLFRVSKRNSKIVGIKIGENGYRWELPNMTQLIKL